MSTSAASALRHPLLDACGVEHGFGQRGSTAPVGTVRPQQVHGTVVALVSAEGELAPKEADAVVCAQPAQSVAVITADCVPILACSGDGRRVAAIHAGWRGLAAGVIESGISALIGLGESSTPLVAVIGPSIGSCCYEVDEPVLSALGERFPARLAGVTRPSSAGHAFVDLAALALIDLQHCGVQADRCAVIPDVCTRCNTERFHSYRRDGARAGRLIHHISTR